MPLFKILGGNNLKQLNMKKIISYLTIILFIGVAILSSCGKDKFDESLPLNPVLIPFKAVTAEDGPVIAYAEISDRNRTIEFEFYNLKSLESVEVHLSISKRAELIDPLDTIMTLDLREPQELTINNLYDDITYTLTASIPEFIIADKSKFQGMKLNNDGAPEAENIACLWDGRSMVTPEAYWEVDYKNYLTRGAFTFDIGTRYDGSYYDLKQFKANLYWAYTNVCPKVYELWGYMSAGEPPIDGNWDDWEKLGTIDNSGSTLDDFAEGDSLHFDKEESPKVRYLRVKAVENYRPNSDTFISLCEITLWGWNM